MLIAAGIGFYFFQQQRSHDDLNSKLIAAQYNPDALNGLLRECGADCPTQLKQEVQARLALFSAEEARYRAAENDPEKLRAYARECRACLSKPEAEARASQLDIQRQEEQRQEAQRFSRDLEQVFSRDLEQAGYNRGALERLIAICGPGCPRPLTDELSARLSTLNKEDEQYRAAQYDADKLRAYLRDCQACLFRGDAQMRIGDVQVAHAVPNPVPSSAQQQVTPGGTLVRLTYLGPEIVRALLSGSQSSADAEPAAAAE